MKENLLSRKPVVIMKCTPSFMDLQTGDGKNTAILNVCKFSFSSHPFFVFNCNRDGSPPEGGSPCFPLTSLKLADLEKYGIENLDQTVIFDLHSYKDKAEQDRQYYHGMYVHKVLDVEVKPHLVSITFLGGSASGLANNTFEQNVDYLLNLRPYLKAFVKMEADGELTEQRDSEWLQFLCRSTMALFVMGGEKWKNKGFING